MRLIVLYCEARYGTELNGGMDRSLQSLSISLPFAKYSAVPAAVPKAALSFPVGRFKENIRYQRSSPAFGWRKRPKLTIFLIFELFSLAVFSVFDRKQTKYNSKQPKEFRSGRFAGVSKTGFCRIAARELLRNRGFRSALKISGSGSGRFFLRFDPNLFSFMRIESFVWCKYMYISYIKRLIHEHEKDRRSC